MELAWGILSNLGFIEHQLGNLEAAKQMYLKSLVCFREVGRSANIPTVLIQLATLEEQRGNFAMALKYADEASSRNRRLGMMQEQEQLESIHSLLKCNSV
ncbi:MAG TPA: tetratricopeptide repeat protein [Ktedonobacteraceae bacterium]|nr:tetratricopeptide repeat protein [Ktedonobacteraceae bacterium]